MKKIRVSGSSCGNELTFFMMNKLLLVDLGKCFDSKQSGKQRSLVSMLDIWVVF